MKAARYFSGLWIGAMLALAAATREARADSARPSLGSYFFETVSSRIGLSQADVVTVLQTRDGYLWVGGGSGLARFDGVHVESYRLSNTPAFLNHLVNCLMEDRNGVLWVGTERGVLQYRDGAFTRLGLDDASVRAIVQDPAGRVWLGTFDHGLYCYENGAPRHIVAEAISGSSITALSVDKAGRLWGGVARMPGAFCSESGRFTRYRPADLNTEILAIAVDRDGVIWFGTRRGLYILKNDRLTPFADGVDNVHIYELGTARDGGVWVMTEVLQKISAGPPYTVVSVAAPLADRPGSVCEDAEGGLWICGRSSGLIYGRQLPYRLLTTDTGLPGNAIRSITQDGRGNVWLSIATHGVVRIDPNGRVKKYSEAEGLPAAEADSIFAASDGTIWIGSVRGLYELRNDVVHFHADIPLVGGIVETHDGAIWVGTSRAGVFRGVNGRFDHVNVGRLDPYYISSLCESPDGTVYAGTWNDGLVRIGKDKVSRITRDDGLPSNEVRALLVDHAGRLWIGMRGRGLAVFEGNHWLNPDTLAQAVGDQVNGIAETPRGDMWLATPAGIMSAPTDTFLAAARTGRPVETLRLVQIGDSQPIFAVRSGKQPIIWQGKDHQLLVATRKGAIAIDTERKVTNPVPPPVHIERVTLDGHSIPSRSPSAIPAGIREISIDYTGVSFVDASRMRFQYKLDGYDLAWIDAGARRTAIYTNLSPRDYVFRVKAANADGVWDEQPASLAFTVEPFFWQTWWFAAAALVLFTSATVALVRYVSFRRFQARLRVLAQQAALDQERARIARDIHDDIGNRLTTISLLSKLTYRDRDRPEKIGDHAQNIGASVRQVTDALDEIVWAINPRNDTLPHLVNYLGQYAVEFLKAAGVACHVDLPAHPPERDVPADVRHNLFLVLKEALHNVVRHSGAKEVTLRVNCDDATFTLAVADNGRGFVARSDRSGADGLRNMDQRMAEIGGKLSIDSGVDRGTAVRATYPWPAPTRGR